MFLIVAEAQCVELRNLDNNTYEELRKDENKKPNGQLEKSSSHDVLLHPHIHLSSYLFCYFSIQ